MKKTKKETLWNIIKNLKYEILYIILLFIFSFFFGLFLPEIGEGYVLKILEYIKTAVKGKNFIELFFIIFWNNFRSGFFAVIFGVIFLPVFACIVNGYILGFVFGKAYENYGILEVLARLIPHGIFELPAFFIAFACGLKIGTGLFVGNIKKKYLNGLKVFLFVVIPLLIIAAIIESALFFVFN